MLLGGHLSVCAAEADTASGRSDMVPGAEIPAGTEPGSSTEELISSLTPEEKVSQMLIILPEALTDGETVTECGEGFREALAGSAPGGFIFMEGNLQDPGQTRQMLEGIKEFYREEGLPEPFLALDEEGGTVTRIAKNEAFGVPRFPSAREIGQSGNVSDAALMGSVIGGYLRELGFNMDLAPVADVLTNPDNTVVAERSFGSDPAAVSAMVRAESEQLMAGGVIPVLKHFPGHGATAGDTHSGYAATEKTLEELMEAELVPFADGADYAPAVMAAHIALPEVTGDDMPASLSETVISGILRERLGYDGIVMTDALNMGAVTGQFSSAEAAVLAVEAGCDLILMPADYHAARQGLLDALASGRIAEERIDESLERILSVRAGITDRAAEGRN